MSQITPDLSGFQHINNLIDIMSKETKEHLKVNSDRRRTIYGIVASMTIPFMIATLLSGIKLTDYIESYFEWASLVGMVDKTSIEHSEKCYKQINKRRAFCKVYLNYDAHYEVDGVQYTRGFSHVSEHIHGGYKRLPKDLRKKYEKELRNEAEPFPTIFYRIDKPTRTRLSLPTEEPVLIVWILVGMYIIWGFLILLHVYYSPTNIKKLAKRYSIFFSFLVFLIIFFACGKVWFSL
jgi:hypothetical protein